MAAVFAPLQKFLNVRNAANGGPVAKVFTKKMSYLAVLNTGSASIWFTLDGSAPAASDADGRTQLPGGMALELTRINFLQIRAISVTDGQGLQIIAMESPQ
jgi:hypothetical protein